MSVKIFILVVVAVCAWLLLAACGSEGPALIREGNEAFEAQQYQEAQEAYELALEEMPDSAEVTYNSANALYKQAQFGEARYKYDVSSETAQADLSQHAAFNTGNSLYKSEQYEEAVEAYKQALRLDPTDKDAKHNLQLTLDRIEEQRQEEEQQQEQQEQGEEGEQQQEQQEPTPGQQELEQEPQPGEQEQPEEQGEQDSGDDNEEAEESEPEEGESSSTESESEPGEAPPTGMTEEQAEQLLESVADNTDTLRERIFPGFGEYSYEPVEREW